MSRSSRACATLLAMTAVLLASLRPEARGACHFDLLRLRCTPSALCERRWDGVRPTCEEVDPKLPRGHPPVLRVAGPPPATFCGLSLDDDGWPTLGEMREWGPYEWAIVIGCVNWGLVGLVYLLDLCRSAAP